MLVKRTLVVIVLLALPVCAQAQQQISPAKRELIKSLIETMHAKENTKTLIDAIGQQLEAQHRQIVEQMIHEQPNLTERQRQSLRDVLLKDDRQQQRYVDLLYQRIDLGQLVENIYYELYDQYYSEAELKDLIAFYQSPTGQKTINVMPKLFVDSMTKARAAVTPALNQTIAEMNAEAAQDVQSKAPAASPEKKPAPPKRHPRR
jgi:uncharacterized protein